jgi:hypothetical protein
VYKLGRPISADDLDEEGRIVLRLLLSPGGYRGCDDDRAWVITQKMARHLHVSPPPNDPVTVERFIRINVDRYVALRAQRP